MNHTTAIILITVVISLAAWQSKPLFNRLIFSTHAVKQGQIDRFLTHGFIHADGIHLLFNMFTLYFFGRAIENFYLDRFGNFGFLAFYVLAIVVAITPSFIRHKNNDRYFSLGASGAVCAVLFAFVLFAPWQSIYLFAILPIPAIVFAVVYVGYSIWADKKNASSINHQAHLFGAVFGILATIATEPKIIIHFMHALINPKF